MTAGLTAGSVSAVLAVLVSLPLRSPSDTLLNSASVALAGLLAGVIAGAIWLAMSRSPSSTVLFIVVWTVLFLPATVAVILYGRSQLDHFTAFVLPLALIIYSVTGILTVAIPRFISNLKWWYAAIAVVAALGLGFGLVGQTDQESGRLELPPPGSMVVPAKAPALADAAISLALNAAEGRTRNAGRIRIQK